MATYQVIQESANFTDSHQVIPEKGTPVNVGPYGKI
jgi:hypothetical protein